MKSHILNSSHQLDDLLDVISVAYDDSIKIALNKIKFKNVDIVFRHEPELVIKELGVGGFTALSGHEIYISLDGSNPLNITEFSLKSTLLHELHHAARFQGVPYQHSLRNLLVQEGLACLFEEEILGKKPIYARQKLTNKNIIDAKEALVSNSPYDHSKWFFGTAEIKKWFGYTYGYELCKAYSKQANKTAAELVNVNCEDLIKV